MTDPTARELLTHGPVRDAVQAVLTKHKAPATTCAVAWRAAEAALEAWTVDRARQHAEVNPPGGQL